MKPSERLALLSRLDKEVSQHLRNQKGIDRMKQVSGRSRMSVFIFDGFPPLIDIFLISFGLWAVIGAAVYILFFDN